MNTATCTTVTAAIRAVGEVLVGTDPTPGDESLRSAIADLQRQLPGVNLTLIEHRESYDGSTATDVLIEGEGRAVSVGIAGSSRIPWPVRATTRAEEYTLLRVNGRQTSVGDAVAMLDFVFDDSHLLRRMLHTAVVNEYLDHHPVEFTEQEAVDAVAAFRRGKRLYTAEQTRQWLESQRLNWETFVQHALSAARYDAVRRSVTAEAIDQEFARRGEELDELTIAWVDAEAPEAIDLSSDPLSAVLTANRAGFRAGVDACRVRDLDLRGTSAGTWAGIDVRLAVLDRRPAHLDDELRQSLAAELFAGWLDERAAGADIEWYWGTRDQTRALD